jgi:uridine kinase
MKLLLEKWRGYLREEQGSSVIAHLVGQAGSGKTYFIENTLLKKYPEIVAKDLDDFDDEADAAVANGKGDKSWRQSGDINQIDQKLARKHFNTVQGLVNQFLKENRDKKIFLAGMSVFPWVQGNNELDVGNPQMKIYLDIDPQVSAKRRIARDVEKGLYGDEKPTKEEFQNELKWAEEEKAQLLSAGYKSATPEEIVKAVDGVMQGESDETPT